MPNPVPNPLESLREIAILCLQECEANNLAITAYDHPYVYGGAIMISKQELTSISEFTEIIRNCVEKLEESEVSNG